MSYNLEQMFMTTDVDLSPNYKKGRVLKEMETEVKMSLTIIKSLKCDYSDDLELMECLETLESLLTQALRRVKKQ